MAAHAEPIFQDFPVAKNSNISMPAIPNYRDIGAVYFADSCEPLLRASDCQDVRLDALARGHYPGKPFPDDDLGGVMTLGYWDSAKQQNWGLDWHRNEGIEITYLARGELDFSVDERQWLLSAGTITITRPWQRHRVGNPYVGPSHLHWLIFDVGVRRPNQPWIWPSWMALSASDLRELTGLLQFNERCVWPASTEISDTFAALAGCVSDRTRNNLQSRLRILLSWLLLEVLEMLQRQNVPPNEKLASTRHTVSVFLQDLAHHTDRKWSLTDLAESCGLGRTQFSMYCWQLTNMSPMEYVAKLRMQAAAQLLEQQPDLTITEVAFRCGFESSQYFSASFRRYFQTSPRTYGSENLRAQPKIMLSDFSGL